MAGVNKVILLGNLGKDPEVRTLESGRKVAKFSLATTESYRDKNGEKVDRTEWHNVIFWGPIADVIEKYLKKGSTIYVEGRIVTRSYDDKEGVKKYVTEIEGQTMTMLGGKQGGSGYENNQNIDNSSKSNNNSNEPVNQNILADDTDDLPF
jgi:single-strand DNA-binding protein